MMLSSFPLGQLLAALAVFLHALAEQPMLLVSSLWSAGSYSLDGTLYLMSDNQNPRSLDPRDRVFRLSWEFAE